MKALARNAKQIGNIIRSERKRTSLSQKQLASMAGLRQASISGIESGTPNTKLQTLLLVLAALGLEFQITQRSTNDWSLEG